MLVRLLQLNVMVDQYGLRGITNGQLA